MKSIQENYSLQSGISHNPYNIFNPLKDAIPENQESVYFHQLLGCVTIAVGQILNYYGYPQTLRRSDSDETLTVNWSNVNIVSLPDTTKKDLPLFLRYVNKGVKTQNGDNGSSSTIKNAQSFFELNGYSTSLYRGRYISVLVSEAKARRPAYVRGTDNRGEGHAFVCNGYKSINKRIAIELKSTHHFTVKDYSTDPYHVEYYTEGKRTSTGEYLNFNLGWGDSSTWVLIPTDKVMDLCGFNKDISILTVKL